MQALIPIVGKNQDPSRRIVPRVIKELREGSEERINKNYFQFDLRRNCVAAPYISSNTSGCLYKTSRPIKRGERVCRSNALYRSSSSLVTWPHPGRLNSLIRRSRLNSNYLKQKTATRCLRKWQQDVVAPVPAAELEHLHQDHATFSITCDGP